MKTRLAAPLFLLVSAFACGGDEGNGSFVPTTIVTTVDATAAECPGGGTKILVGVDVNSDGVVLEGEASSVELVCSGTDGDPGEPGEAGPQSLVTTSTEPAGVNCPNGGTRIDVGVDTSGDGVLDPDEIQATTYVCTGDDGADATPVLTQSSTDVAVECGAAGGTRLEVGIDINANGTLDPNEITSSTVVCNGADASTIIQIDPEAPGANCSAGGERIQTGTDDNDNGVLDVAEVLSTEYVCDPTVAIADVTPLAIGDADCTGGGQRIDTGLDLDGDGILQAGEVIDTAFSCNGDAGELALVAQAPIAPGPECADGGTRLAIGLDLDFSGTLETIEEASVVFVCNGAPGIDGTAGGAVNLSPEPPGTNCLSGGTRIETGIDANANGVLDAAEVSKTEFVCDGTTLVALVDIVPEPAGALCPDGGQRILSGVDTDASGTLEAGEVSNTLVVCNTVAVVPIEVEAALLADPLVNNPYSASITANGGSGGNYTWAVVGGSLPPGLNLDLAGTPSANISGTPTATGSFTFTVEVTDFFGNTDTEVFTINVSGSFEISTVALPRANQGSAYSFTLGVDGGVAPFTWTVLEGALPAGLTLSAGGVISGTPTGSAGSYVVIQVTDGSGDTRRLGTRIKGRQRFIAYCGDVVTAATDELYIQEIDAAGTPVGAPVLANFPTADADCFDDIEFSPAGDLVAFTGDETSGIEELFVADLSAFPTITTTKVNAPLTSTSNDVLDFKWSTTGEFLAYRADDDVNSRDDLFVVDLRSLPTVANAKVSQPPMGASSSLEPLGYEWIPGGNKLVYVSDELVSLEQILYFYDAMSGAPRVQVNGPLPTGGDVQTNFKVSPNGSWVAYVADEGIDNDFRLYLADVSGATPGAPIDIAGTIAASGDVQSATNDIAFAPNCDGIAFVADGDNLGEEVYFQDIRNLGSARVRLSPELTSTSFSTFEIQWAPDSRLVAARGDQVTSVQNELYVYDLRIPGSSVIASDPTATSADVETFTWSTTADYLVMEYDGVTSGVDEPWVYFLADPPGSPTRVFPAGPADDVFSYTVSDDGGLVYMRLDAVVDSQIELYVVEVGAGTLSAPVPVNGSMPTGADVQTPFFLIQGGLGVFYETDEQVAAEEQAALRIVAPGPAVGAATFFPPTLPVDGDVFGLAVQEE